MTFPSQGTLNDLATPNRSNHYYPSDSFIDQFLRKISFWPIPLSTDALQFCRADSIPVTTFFAKTDTLPNNATDVSLLSNTLQRVGDHVEIDNFDSISGRGVDEFAQQVKGIKLSILRQLSSQIIIGSASPNILGFRNQAGTTVGASNGAVDGGFLTLQDLLKARNSCKPTDDFVGAGPDCWISNEKTFREVFGLLNQEGISVEWLFDRNLRVSVPMIFGIPWYISNSVPLNETKGAGTNLTSVFITKRSGPTAVRLLYAKDPHIPCNPYGIHIYDIPIQATQNKRLKAVAGYYTLHIPEPNCVVRLDGINPTQFAL